MCCFTDDIASVDGTRIFARLDGHGAQCLVYQMNVEAPREVAMVLPVPMKRGGNFQFVDLSSYPTFFDDMERPFAIARQEDLLGGDDFDGSASGLAVESVGDFEASLVPTRADFARLDKRFRFDDKVWSQLPDYSAFAFAVFKLKSGVQSVHPMAFKFSSASDDLFFPTLHVHKGGRVEKKAAFDHFLYAQLPAGRRATPEWVVSLSTAESFIDVDRAAGLVAKKRVYRREMIGTYPNQDTRL